MRPMKARKSWTGPGGLGVGEDDTARRCLDHNGSSTRSGSGMAKHLRRIRPCGLYRRRVTRHQTHGQEEDRDAPVGEGIGWRQPEQESPDQGRDRQSYRYAQYHAQQDQAHPASEDRREE